MSLRDSTILRKAVYLWRNWRNKHSYTSGIDNKVVNHGGVKVGSRIQIVGKGNRLTLEKGSMLLNSLVRITGNNNEVVLKANCYISGAELWVEDNGCVIEIGESTYVGHHSHLACTGDGCRLIVGANGMISSYVQIRTGDSHSILNLEGARINPEQHVTIGEHCWIGEGAKVLKGVTLEGDNIVATGAIVTQSFGENLLIGGIPAGVLKENVTWDSRRI